MLAVTKMASALRICRHSFYANRDPSLTSGSVSSVSYGKDLPIAMLAAKRIGWKDAYEKMTVTFGTSQGKYKPDSIRLHNDLRRRQLIPTGTISYPSVAPSPASSATSITKNIDHQVTPGESIFKISHE
jgi:hypothetical protein